MSLTDDEQRALELIERELRRGDPVLADRMEDAPTNEQRRRRVILARRGIWTGVAVILIGLMAAQGIVSLGAVVAGYGVVIVLTSIGVAAHNRTRPARPGARRRWER